MFRIKFKPLLLLGLLTFLFLGLPKDAYNPKREAFNNNYNENLFANRPSIPKKHKKFLLKLIPLIQHANQEVLTERERLFKIYSLLDRGKKIKPAEQRWLKKLGLKYRGKKNNSLFENETSIILEYVIDLIGRVDMVPIRLALAQAAIESGWGRSRFCVEGNAYFGIHCYSPNCGIKARADLDGGFEVKSYKSAQESVDDYLLFLNSKRGMQRFRDERVQYFHKDTTPNILKLAGSMKGYSAIGQSYQDIIGSIMKHYIPEGIANN